LVFWKLGARNQRYVWLTVASYVFYGVWNYKFCALMAFSTVVSFLSGLAMARYEGKRRKFYLILPITIDLLLLAYFKYANFGLRSIAGVAHWFNWPLHFDFVDIILPVGISFYTFYTITYIVDCYRRASSPPVISSSSPATFPCFRNSSPDRSCASGKSKPILNTSTVIREISSAHGHSS
jgi:alginate O-acetyltransferase complex protein AlgI